MSPVFRIDKALNWVVTTRRAIPPLTKRDRRDLHSLALQILLVALVFLSISLSAFAAPCLKIESGTDQLQLVQTAVGDQLRLRFKHSIYGSTVEEILAVREQGLELTELRYSEARLVEFYGHEQARQENGNWVVAPEPIVFPALDLRVSDDGALILILQTAKMDHAWPLRAGGAFRIAVSACHRDIDG